MGAKPCSGCGFMVACSTNSSLKGILLAKHKAEVSSKFLEVKDPANGYKNINPHVQACHEGVAMQCIIENPLTAESQTTNLDQG